MCHINLFFRCPHCEYSNVEKTKVRMHIRTMHSGKNPYVRTNREMLSWMSDEVRKYFLRVDKNGMLAAIALLEYLFYCFDF